MWRIWTLPVDKGVFMENSNMTLDASLAAKLLKRLQASFKQVQHAFQIHPELSLLTDTGKLYRTQVAVRTIFAAIAISYLLTAGFSLYAKSLALPFGMHLPARNHSAAVAAPDDTSKASTRTPDSPWTYDFSKYPNGPVPQRLEFRNRHEVASYNKELQSYTPRTKNVRVENGVLVIEAQKEQYRDRGYTSARINTLNKFDFTYGTIEADVQMPTGRGTWPAVWMMPSKNIYKPADYGITQNDPDYWALNGEIDFAEAVGFIPGQNIPAAHTYNSVKRAPMVTPAMVPDQSSTFHRYGVTKTPDKLIFSVDGVPYATRERTGDTPMDWPYNQPYYLIINLAIGGNWAGSHGIDDSTAPWQMKIRSVSYRPL
jgi:beta-glucanase (GH16 family)